MSTAVALGTFDGVHTGHAAIIARACEEAQKRGLEPVIYTFTGHPLAAFGKRPPLLMDDDERLASLAKRCRVVADDFTPALASTPPEEFIERLYSRLDMRCAVAGFNYTFGKGGAGDVNMLSRLGESLGFDAVAVEPVLYEGAPVSSTRIRELIEAGDAVRAAAMLGAPYTLSGSVGRNRGIGRSIGFPTANLTGYEGRVIPGEGVYAAVVTLRGARYPAVTNVGCNPTFGGERLTIESYILDFDGDIYGESLSVAFIERIRGDMDFGTPAALSARIALDAAIARKALTGRE